MKSKDNLDIAAFQEKIMNSLPKTKVRYWQHIMFEYNPFTGETRQVSNYLTFEKGVTITKEEQEISKQKKTIKVNKTMEL